MSAPTYMAVLGVWCLMDVQLAVEPLGLVLAFANCALFMLYVTPGHKIAADGGASGIDRLAMARLSRATFALMLSLLPAIAVLIGSVVLHQIPAVIEASGIAGDRGRRAASAGRRKLVNLAQVRGVH